MRPTRHQSGTCWHATVVSLLTFLLLARAFRSLVLSLKAVVSMDQVFIISRMREAFDRTDSTEEAIVEGVGRTGRLITSAALILGLAFVAMSAAPGTEAKMFATAPGGGILLDATLIRGVLAPAAVALLGRWNGWLPRGAGATAARRALSGQARRRLRRRALLDE